MSSFEKYHGLGNDFIVVELDTERQISIEESIRLCDRHFGIGADGVLYVLPASEQNDDSHFKMVVINADGSRPEMCGNGLRCVALYLVHQRKAASGKFSIATDAGTRACIVSLEGEARATVTTSLGIGKSVDSLNANVLGQECTFQQISMGNPHAITFRQRIKATELDELGSRLSASIHGGSNIEVAEIVGDNKIIVDVWERGVGRTLACGTGAAATAFAAIKQRLVDGAKPVEVTLPGGSLVVTLGTEDEVELTGPAERVYSGKLTG